jgi:protein-L-isoaspartate(D-aspartate) O-methyltransferase
VPRELFVPEDQRRRAYRDGALRIGEGQTISQPWIVACMCQLLELRGEERVLEVGTGSGYAAAILAELALDVFSIERLTRLANDARERLARLGYRNVRVLEGDGSLGLPSHAPFDAIAVAAGAPRVPAALREQLAPGGRLVIPVRTAKGRQVLLRITRTRDTYHEERLTSVRFVPLVGEQGYPDAEQAVQPGVARDGTSSLAALIRECAEPAVP